MTVHDCHFRKPLEETWDKRPMGGHRVAIEQPRGGQPQSALADRCDIPLCPGGHQFVPALFHQEVEEGVVWTAHQASERLGSAARRPQDLANRSLSKSRVDLQGESAVASDKAGRLGDEAHLDASPSEHLEGTGYVEDVDAVVDGNNDHAHASSIGD